MFVFQVIITATNLSVLVSDKTVIYSLMCTTLSGLLNPVIYGIFSKSYRRGYWRLLEKLSKCLLGCPVSEEDVLSGTQVHHTLDIISVINEISMLLST